MLTRLRLDPVVRRHDEENGVQSRDSGHHVADEALVSRNVDERHDAVGRELEIGETEIDRDAAALLFLETIGVNARQRLDERAFSMVDVARRADDEVAHVNVPRCRADASSRHVAVRRDRKSVV